MNIYHVQLTGQCEPAVVIADLVDERAGVLAFFDLVQADGFPVSVPVRPPYQPHEWQSWRLVREEMEHL